MDNQEEGSYLSFSSLLKFMKNALPTIIVCIVVCLMVGISACGAIFAINKNQNEITRAIFEIAYEGADEGKTPNGGVLNIQDIASISKISDVLNSNGMEYSPADVRSALSINGYYSPELRALLASVKGDEKKLIELLGNRSLHHTQFVISLNHKAVANMSRNDAQAFLDELLNRAKTSMFTFSANYSFMTAEEYTVENFSRYEYLERISIISLEYMKIEQHIADISDTAKSKKDEPTVKALKALAPYLLGTTTNIASFETFIVNKGIAIDKTDAVALISSEIVKISSELTVLGEQINDLKDAIDAYSLKFQVIVNEAGSIVGGGEYVVAIYEKMFNNYLNLLKDKSSQETILEALKLKKLKYESIATTGEASAEDMAKASQLFEKLLNDMSSLVYRVTFITDEFYQNANMSSMRVNVPAALLFDSSVDINWMLCIIMSIAIGTLLGLVVYPLIKRLITNKENKSIPAEL